MPQKSSSIVKVSTQKSDAQKVIDNAINGDANIFIKETTYKPQVEFVMLFGANFNAVLHDSKLTMTDMRVLFAVIAKMCYGNQIAIKQSAIAVELGIDASNVSRAWKTLTEIGIFIEDAHTNVFLNYDLFIKGKTKTMMNEYKERAKISHEKMEMIPGVIQPFNLTQKSKKKVLQGADDVTF
jgi:Firmicute plasmid replication protein (RepL)